ncbi:hypothetical protein ACW7G2_09005 [Luteimonas sp. A277]
MTSPQLSLAEALLAELARHPEGIALPRLRKRVDARMSLLMRTLAWLGEDTIGGVEGAGLVRIERRGDNEVALLTDRGHAAIHPPP